MATGIDYIEVRIITGKDVITDDILVARLSGAGFEGFEEEKNLLKAFIPKSDFDESRIRNLLEEDGYGFSTSLIPYQNWNETWEAGFEPVVIEDFCAIRADFHPPVKGVQFEIVITPKMSFGTGHHATTYLMIEAMKNTVINDKSVFDFGTGTGVLAILAEKMGAFEVEAIDNDDWSIENGKENLERNNSLKVQLTKSDHIVTSRQFDVLLANINRNVILQHMNSMKKHLMPGGVMILSGLLAGDEDAIVKEANASDLELNARQERNSWICLQFVNR